MYIKGYLISFLAFLVLLGIVPVITLLIQFILVGFHGIKNHYSKCKPYTPKVAIIIPVWNEEDVIASSIDSLMKLTYPADCLRIYAVDDVSSDNTPHIIEAKTKQYPNQVFNLRRPEKIDFGKAAVINHGLKVILNEPWAEAIMIIDADVMFERNTLIKMTRHLADPEVYAVTAYIKEGLIPGNLISHFIGFEYIVAQAAARRAQNVLGVMACLAGGAQLHKRENVIELGGRIDTTTLAEDTYTTIATQLNNHKVIFEGNAIAIAEEPDRINDLWKQRFRWAEGNVQITRFFKKIWFRHKTPGDLGSIFFGLIWFSTLLMPIGMIITSISLNILFFLDPKMSWALFRLFSLTSLFSYLFTTFYSFSIDPQTSKRVWFAGLMFPGVMSLLNMFIAVAPAEVEFIIQNISGLSNWSLYESYLMIWMNTWIALCMFFAWLVYRLDGTRMPSQITNSLLLFVGYGPLLCSITFAAYISQFTKRPMKWNKTIKTGKAQQKMELHFEKYNFKKTLLLDKKQEIRLFFYELFFLGLLVFLCFLHHYFDLS